MQMRWLKSYVRRLPIIKALEKLDAIDAATAPNLKKSELDSKIRQLSEAAGLHLLKRERRKGRRPEELYAAGIGDIKL